MLKLRACLLLVTAAGAQIVEPVEIGPGVTVPVPIPMHDPNYSDEGRMVKAQGTIVLSLVVGDDGLPREINITKPMGMGLDEQAIKAVSTWRFRPGRKDGKPVAMVSPAEINFRIFDAGMWYISRLVFEHNRTGRPILQEATLPEKPSTRHTTSCKMYLKVNSHGKVVEAIPASDSDPTVVSPLMRAVRTWHLQHRSTQTQMGTRPI